MSDRREAQKRALVRPDQRRPRGRRRRLGPDNERGMAMVIAMLALLLLTATAAGFLIAVNVGGKTTSRHVRYGQALNIAEAGIAEAAQRIRWGDVPNNMNPLQVTQIFNTAPGFVPVLGADSLGLATAQPDTARLAYSHDRRSDYVLTIKYKTDANKSAIYRYDDTKSPAVQTTSGSPIFEITAIGRKGTDRSKVVTEVFMVPIQVLAKAALAADVNIRFTGTSFVCGYDHEATTPAGTQGRGPCLGFEIGADHLPGAWTTGSTIVQGASQQWGDPVGVAANQVGFYKGPWEVLKLTQAQFFEWVGVPFSAEPMPPKGIYYLDSDGETQNTSGDFAYHGGTGEGFLYVDGDLTLNGEVTFRGLIYVEGDLMINGGAWILGGVIVKGRTYLKHGEGNATILYSEDAITQNISKYGGAVSTLSWRENP